MIGCSNYIHMQQKMTFHFYVCREHKTHT